MKIKNFPCKISRRLLIYSLFAILCQLSFSFLHMSHLIELGAIHTFIFADHIQSALSSLALTIGGAYLIDRVILSFY